ncbi:MAG: ABC transporter substrate-binding protein [Candidatus Sedimenticola sp. (ex Thyasira tokunagai)]
MKKQLTLGFIIVLGLVVASIQFRSDQPPALPVQQIDELTVAAYKGDFSALIWIAEAKELFRKNGLRVTIEEFDSGVLPVRRMLEGKAHVATSGEFVIVSHLARSNDLRVLGSIVRADAIEVIAKKDAGISQPADLQGKRVALKKGSQAEFVLDDFLLDYGLQNDDAEIIDLNPMEMEAALLGDKVDAVVVWNPFTHQLKKALGENAMAWNPHDLPFFFNITTTSKTLTQRKGELKKFMAAMIEAARFAKENDEQARIIVRDRLGYQEEYSVSSWNAIKLELSLSQALKLAMENEARWMVDKGKIRPEILSDLSSYFAFSVMESVHPKGISMRR